MDPWDRAYFSARVQRERYAVDAAALKPWFELDRVIHQGVFAAATRLYGIAFTERHDLPVYHPEVRVWEVSDADGTQLGLFLATTSPAPPARRVDEQHPGRRLAVRGTTGGHNNLNIPAPAEGQPALLTLDEVRTLFHEFGHALHGLFNGPTRRWRAPQCPATWNTRRRSTRVAIRPELVAVYARHVDTGNRCPRAYWTALTRRSLGRGVCHHRVPRGRGAGSRPAFAGPG
ncbi:M3 family metallopeptidase [Arthrobacter sp.]|uniref:M3 family metallopeptidase n=1 Tax=Arthrobacter sp. TaxID=1667 RepID=UPI003A8C8C75